MDVAAVAKKTGLPIEKVEVPGGVYFLFDESGELVYVGRSTNVPMRIYQHRTDKEKDFTDVYVYECDEPTSIDKEASLIRELHPKYNKSCVHKSKSFYTSELFIKDSLRRDRHRDTRLSVQERSLLYFHNSSEKIFSVAEKYGIYMG